MKNIFTYTSIMISSLLISGCGSGSGGSSSSSQSTIKATGQIASYNDFGIEVTDASLKDDAFYSMGVKPSYSRDDSREVVVDSITNLEWQDDSNVSTVKKSWLSPANYDICKNGTNPLKRNIACRNTQGDTAKTYCSNLRLLGESDWRLPSSSEIESIVDFTKVNPSIDTEFKNKPPYLFWSSSSQLDERETAWAVYFYSGSINSFSKDQDFFVRCVRDI